MTEGLSIRAYARHRRELGLSGGTHRAVQKAIADGRLERSVAVVDGKAKIDPVRADQEWAAKTDTLRANAGGDPTAGRPLGALDDAPRSSAREGSDEVAGQARRAQAIRLTFQAKLAELEYRQRVGELVEAKDVELEQHRSARAVRDRIRAVADRLAAGLAAENDPHRVRMMLAGELDQALGEVSRILSSGQARPGAA